METVTLQGRDFSTVHNAVCDLRSLVERMTHSMIKIDDVQRVIEQFEQGLADAYAQDRAAFDRKSDAYEAVRKGAKLEAIWSIYEVDDLSQLHPYVGATEVHYKDHWGEQPVSVPVLGATWADLYAAADAAIRASGDLHHIFIEQFRPQGNRLVLSTGS
jgi:hypothetical protein